MDFYFYLWQILRVGETILVDAFAGDTIFFSGKTHSSANFSVHLVILAAEIRVSLSALQVWKSSVVPGLCR